MTDPSMSEDALRGYEMLRREREEENAKLEHAIKRAAELFAGHPDGVFEYILYQRLLDEGMTPSHASAGVDELRSTGVAKKNWTTGFLSPVPDQA